MQLSITLGGHFKHTIVSAAGKMRALQAREALTVAEAIQHFSIEKRQVEVLVTVDGRNIPPGERDDFRLADGNALVISPWYTHLRM